MRQAYFEWKIRPSQDHKYGGCIPNGISIHLMEWILPRISQESSCSTGTQQEGRSPASTLTTPSARSHSSTFWSLCLNLQFVLQPGSRSTLTAYLPSLLKHMIARVSDVLRSWPWQVLQNRLCKHWQYSKSRGLQNSHVNASIVWLRSFDQGEVVGVCWEDYSQGTSRCSGHYCSGMAGSTVYAPLNAERTRWLQCQNGKLYGVGLFLNVLTHCTQY